MRGPTLTSLALIWSRKAATSASPLPPAAPVSTASDVATTASGVGTCIDTSPSAISPLPVATAMRPPGVEPRPENSSATVALAAPCAGAAPSAGAPWRCTSLRCTSPARLAPPGARSSATAADTLPPSALPSSCVTAILPGDSATSSCALLMSMPGSSDSVPKATPILASMPSSAAKSNADSGQIDLPCVSGSAYTAAVVLRSSATPKQTRDRRLVDRKLRRDDGGPASG